MSSHIKKYVTPSGRTRWAIVVGETVKSTHGTRYEAEYYQRKAS